MTLKHSRGTPNPPAKVAPIEHYCPGCGRVSVFDYSHDEHRHRKTVEVYKCRVCWGKVRFVVS